MMLVSAKNTLFRILRFCKLQLPFLERSHLCTKHFRERMMMITTMFMVHDSNGTQDSDEAQLFGYHHRRWDDWKAELSNNIIFVITYDKFIIYAVLLVEATKPYHLEINNMVSNACWKGETVLPKEFCTGAPLLPSIYLDLFTCSGHVAEEEG